MRETKRQMSLYSFYDHTGIEKHLARMAERGWLLCGIGQLFWHYRRIEPRRITFSVCYFPKATIYDPYPSEGQEEFYDLCAHAGWTLAGESGQLQVFCHQGENPTPIDTDPALEVEAIHQSAKKTVLPANFLLLGVAVLNLGLFLWRFWDNPVLTLASGGTLLALVAYTLILVNCTVELCSYFRWRRRARRAAERGELTYEAIARNTAENAARLFGLPQKGRIEAGRDADLVLVERLDRPEPLDTGKLFTKSRDSAELYRGLPLCCRVAATYVRGRRVFAGGAITGEQGWGTLVSPVL